MSQSEEHLRLLSIFHYVVAALASLFALFPLIHLVIGLAILSGRFPGKSTGGDDIRWLGGFFVAFASVWIVMGLSFAACVIVAGRSLAKRTRYTFCLVMAGLECMFVPFGTVLGVFTLIVLTKDDVKSLFGAAPSST
ncbi:MAG: hypothetical protein WC538_11640 [Thermoanaerobaculia bacterium]|jgi:hypothetical protein